MVEKESMGASDAVVQKLLQAYKKAVKIISGNEQSSTTMSCDQKKFVKVMTWIQLFLGFIAICCALLGIVAVYEVKMHIVKARATNILFNADSDFLSSARENIERDFEEKKEMLQDFQQAMTSLKRNNCSGSAKFDYNVTLSRDKWNFPIRTHDFMSSSRCEVDYYLCLSTLDPTTSWTLELYTLKIEYLGVPGWTGLMLIVTSLVGFCAVDNWTHPRGNRASYLTYNVMNILCLLLFGPAMMTSACFQIAKADVVSVDQQPSNLPFRAGLGRVTGVFAGLVLLVSLIVAVAFLIHQRNKPVKPTGEKEIPEGKEILVSSVPVKVPLA